MPLSPVDRDYLQGLIRQARDPWPEGWQAWRLQGQPHVTGLLSAERAQLFRLALPPHTPLVLEGDHWVWHADTVSPQERSALLQTMAQQLRAQGQLNGWRNEAYACWGWTQEDWPYHSPELFRLERAAYRFFGLRSHASHIHGITPDGRMWCGRRAHHKATDPGLLDNLAAGGLPAGEQPAVCAVREIQEEAGLTRTLEQLMAYDNVPTTERAEKEGWHSERLFIYSTTLTDAETPVNLDGEVSEFLCLEIPEVLQRIRAGEFTRDAACAIAVFLLSQASR